MFKFPNYPSFGRSFLIVTFAALSAQAEIGVQSFQIWKTSRVDEARSGLEKIEKDKPASSSAKAKGEASSRLHASSRAARVDQKVQQAQMNLEVAKELTINDYFVLYLSQFKTREAFVEAAKKLNPEEAADLMMSYQKHLTAGASNFDEISPTANALGTPVPTKSN